MDNRKVAQQVIEHLGGKENITNALHCVTRLRFNVKEDAKVNGAAIEAIDGVMGMQIKNGQYQIIIGPMVADVFLEVEDLLGHSGSEEPKTRMGNVLDIITGIFSAILPALVAGGMLKGILAMLEAMGMSSGGGPGQYSTSSRMFRSIFCHSCWLFPPQENSRSTSIWDFA